MKQTIRKTITVLLALVMVLTLLPTVTVTARADGPISLGNVTIPTPSDTTPIDVPTPTDVPATPTDLETPLTLEAKTDGTIVVTEPQSGMEYSINGGTKHAVPTTAINVSMGDKVAFYGTADCYEYTTISGGTAQCYIYGNIMSLIDPDPTNFASATALTEAFTFAHLFEGNACLFSHPDRKLVLPATTLAPMCYGGMFFGCTGLTTAPALPATTLAVGCYTSMFDGCANLTTTPELPATTLADMCYSGMFNGCAKLTTAPALPATTLAEMCYNGMFQNCTSLTTAPELRATTLEFACYGYMFSGCNNLNAVTCLATDISASKATAGWLERVAPTGTFTKASGMTGWTLNSPSGIPEGWTAVDYADATSTPVTYLDADGVEQSCATYTDVPSADIPITCGTEGETTWYVVKENATIANGVTFYGDVRLILCDGATLTVNNPAANGYGITNSGSASLTVYAQSTGADMGALVATGQGCGIRGNKSAVTINGGDLHVSGKYGICMRSAALTINGGKVTATADGSDKSVAIREIYGGITINGGTVIATGGQYGIRIAESLTVNGGEITASGSGCAIFTNTSAPVTLAPGLGVYAGDDESAAVKVTKAFPANHPQKWAHIYEITKSEYTLTIPAAVTVSGAGWNATGGVGASCELAKGKKLTVTAASGEAFALVCAGKGQIGYYLAATATDTQPTTTWTFTALDDDPATQPMGIIVSETDYRSARPGTYTDTVTFTAQVEDASPLQKLTVPAHVWSDELQEDVQVDVDFYYVPGETWKQAIENHSTENTGWSIFGTGNVKGERYINAALGITNDYDLADEDGNPVDYNLVIDSNGSYTLVDPAI